MRSALLIGLILISSWAIAGDTPMQDKDPELTAMVKSLSPEQLHEMVLQLEQDPLGKDAGAIRAGLLLYFEDVDFIFCLNSTLVALNESKKEKLHDPIWMQAIFGSGDYVTQHPDRIDDQFAYALAGWESALRTYEVIRDQKPKARLEDLDGLVKLRDQGRLPDYVRENLCEED